MRVFRDLSIKHKLTLIIMLISIVALLLSCTLFIIYDLGIERREMMRDLLTQADIIGNNSTAALSFNDVDSATEMLAALKAKPEIIAACLYDKEGQLFAIYRRADQQGVDFLPPVVEAGGNQFAGDRLRLFRQIVMEETVIGTVCLESDVERLYERRQNFIRIVGIILLISADVPNELSGDAGRLRQVIINLVDNAIKFTGRGKVMVSVNLLSQTAQAVYLQFAVEDTGIGIAPEKQQAIFEAFTQADGSTTRRYGGTGLGLTISARLVEMMGGQIDVASQEGQGSRFRFTAQFQLDPQASRTVAGDLQLTESVF